MDWTESKIKSVDDPDDVAGFAPAGLPEQDVEELGDGVASMGWMPHSLLRIAVRLWTRWGLSLLRRGLVVTNFGVIDRYLEPFGENVLHATMLGPWIIGTRVPLVVATGFRDRLTLSIHGFSPEGVSLLRDRLESLIRTQWDDDRPRAAPDPAS